MMPESGAVQTPWSGRGVVAAPKTEIPTPPNPLLSRPRLLDLVVPEPSGDSYITLLCGPAGSGKSTLLADWALQRPGERETAVAWVSLGAEDNDVLILWSGILDALERCAAWPEYSQLRQLSALDRRIDAAFMVAFSQAFAEISPQPVVLILDDLHHIVDREALATLDRLFRQTPRQLRLVLSSRFMPPLLTVPKLRLEGRVRDIDGATLAFTPLEANDLLRTHNLDLSEPDLELVLRRTEGWAAGLRLAAMSLARAPEPASLLADFVDDDRAVADYLVGEVLARQNPHVREFLLATCICEQLTVELARLLSGREDAGALLDELERTNSFIAKLGRDRYRYHPMLRRYLRAELGRQQHGSAERLHRLAAGWFENRGETLLAIDHAAKAADPQLLSAMLGAHGLQHITNGEGAQVRRALGRVPADLMSGPAAVLVGAAAALDARDPAAAEGALARWSMPDDGAPEFTDPATAMSAPLIRALRTAVDLQWARSTSEPAAVLALLEREAPTTGHPDVDQLVFLERGVSWLWLGRPDSARDEVARTLDLALGGHRDWMVMQCLAALAGIAGAAGDFIVAESRASEALRFAESRGWTDSRPNAEARIVLGWLAYQRLDDQLATMMSELAIDEAFGPRSRVADDLDARLLRLFAQFGCSPNRHVEVRAVRELWRAREPGYLPPHLVARASVIEQQLALAVGEVQWAADVAERTHELIGDGVEVDLLRAVVQAHRGRPRMARQLLAPWLADDASPSRTILTDIEVWLWEARLAERSGERQRAEVAISEAVSRAAPGGILRPLQRGGREVADLLARMVGRFGHDEAFAAAARAALGSAELSTDSLLTTRELELLTELPSLRTAEEIASSYYLSVNTVKTHIRGIYRKLGVNNRRDAVQLARRRGLL